jgi:hypothetical protein
MNIFCRRFKIQSLRYSFFINCNVQIFSFFLITYCTNFRNLSGYRLIGDRLLLWNHTQKFILWDFTFKKRSEMHLLSDLLICVEYLDRSRLELVSEWRPYLKVVFGLWLLPLRFWHSEALLAATLPAHCQESLTASPLPEPRWKYPEVTVSLAALLAVSVAAYTAMPN